MDSETCKSLMESGPGAALAKYLAEQIAELDNLSDIEGGFAIPILRGLLSYNDNVIIKERVDEYVV